MAPERHKLVVRRGRWKEAESERRGEKSREAIVDRLSGGEAGSGRCESVVVDQVYGLRSARAIEMMSLPLPCGPCSLRIRYAMDNYLLTTISH